MLGKNIKGWTSGKLTALEFLRREKTFNERTGYFKYKYVWLCKCECGNTREVAQVYIRARNIKSCGKCTPRINNSIYNVKSILTV